MTDWYSKIEVFNNTRNITLMLVICRGGLEYIKSIKSNFIFKHYTFNVSNSTCFARMFYKLTYSEINFVSSKFKS